MKTEQTTPTSIDEYIAGFPDEVQERLEKVRMTIREAVPDAEETFSYQMPTFTLKGKYLVYFAAYKNHIGLYPMPSGIEEFKEELAPYQSGKVSARFPFDQPIPLDLITKIVKLMAKENMGSTVRKGKKK
jgi:uncharacterized protein YdhG (YjbR/CyaY superfamily)